VARFTVDEAYARLAAEGYVVGKRGSGTYVADHVQLRGPEQEETRPVPAAGRRLSAWSQRLPLSPNEVLPRQVDPDTIRFMTGMPALDAFPWTAWQRLLGRETRNQSLRARSYSDPAGLTVLREEIAAYLARSRGL